jgi:hypothetical protein
MISSLMVHIAGILCNISCNQPFLYLLPTIRWSFSSFCECLFSFSTHIQYAVRNAASSTVDACKRDTYVLLAHRCRAWRNGCFPAICKNPDRIGTVPWRHLPCYQSSRRGRWPRIYIKKTTSIVLNCFRFATLLYLKEPMPCTYRSLYYSSVASFPSIPTSFYNNNEQSSPSERHREIPHG